MRRLLLASNGIAALSELADVAGLRFAFVPTAAGPDADSQPWVQKDRRQLELLGCESSTVDLASAERADVELALASADGVFLTGGNSYLLLWHARTSGFAELVVPLVESGGLIYTGTSAGAVLAGPDGIGSSSGSATTAPSSCAAPMSRSSIRRWWHSAASRTYPCRNAARVLRHRTRLSVRPCRACLGGAQRAGASQSAP